VVLLRLADRDKKQGSIKGRVGSYHQRMVERMDLPCEFDRFHRHWGERKTDRRDGKTGQDLLLGNPDQAPKATKIYGSCREGEIQKKVKGQRCRHMGGTKRFRRR